MGHQSEFLVSITLGISKVPKAISVSTSGNMEPVSDWLASLKVYEDMSRARTGERYQAARSNLCRN